MKDRAAYLAFLVLSLYGLLSVSYLWHEVGHGLGAELAGGSFDGITFKPPATDQMIWKSYPLVEDVEAVRFWAMSGGPLASLALGVFAIGLTYWRRNSLLPVLLVVATLGATFGALPLGLPSGRPRDFYNLMAYRGFPREATAWTAVWIGVPACFLLGMWYLRRLRYLGDRYLGHQPNWVLSLNLTIPVLFAAAVIYSGRWWWASLLGLVPIVLMSRCPKSLRKLLFTGSAVALGSVAMLGIAAWALSPTPARRSAVEAKVARHPDDEIVLRRSAFELFTLSTMTENTEERESLVAAGRALRKRALELSPHSAGANFDWAMCLVAQGDSLAVRGDEAASRSHWLEAVPYLRAAHGLDPRNRAIVEHLAIHYEKLGQMKRASLFYQVYAQLVAEDATGTSSAQRHQRVARRRGQAISAPGPSRSE